MPASAVVQSGPATFRSMDRSSLSLLLLDLVVVSKGCFAESIMSCAIACVPLPCLPYFLWSNAEIETLLSLTDKWRFRSLGLTSFPSINFRLCAHRHESSPCVCTRTAVLVLPHFHLPSVWPNRRDG